MVTFNQQGQHVTTQSNIGFQVNVAGDLDAAAFRMLLERTHASEEELARACQRLAELPLDEIPEPAPLPRRSRMLLSRNDSFAG